RRRGCARGSGFRTGRSWPELSRSGGRRVATAPCGGVRSRSSCTRRAGATRRTGRSIRPARASPRPGPRRRRTRLTADLVQRARALEHPERLLAVPTVAHARLLQGGKARHLLLERVGGERPVVVVDVVGR